MAYKAKRTEHSGAKHGQGAHWGPKKEAKAESNRQRREAGKSESRHKEYDWKTQGRRRMSNVLAELEQKAAQLSPAERAQLALSLIQSLEPTDEGDLEEAWRLEAEARLAQIEKGEARVVPGDEVFTTVRRRLS